MRMATHLIGERGGALEALLAARLCCFTAGCSAAAVRSPRSRFSARSAQSAARLRTSAAPRPAEADLVLGARHTARGAAVGSVVRVRRGARAGAAADAAHAGAVATARGALLSPSPSGEIVWSIQVN